MKFPNSILFYVTTLTMTLGLGSSAQAQTPSNTISTARWSLDINSGIHDDTPYPINDCSSCKAVSNYGGLNASFDVNYHVDHLALGLLVESQAKILSGPTQAFVGALVAATTDYEIANIRGGLEAGIHYLENYDEFMGPHTITDSDWAALPYAGLRVEADITVWEAAGLNLGVWSSLRADLTTFEQQILVHKGFWSEGLQMQAYQAGGLQLAGGVKTGIRF